MKLSLRSLSLTLLLVAPNYLHAQGRKSGGFSFDAAVNRCAQQGGGLKDFCETVALSMAPDDYDLSLVKKIYSQLDDGRWVCLTNKTDEALGSITWDNCVDGAVTHEDPAKSERQKWTIRASKISGSINQELFIFNVNSNRTSFTYLTLNTDGHLVGVRESIGKLGIIQGSGANNIRFMNATDSNTGVPNFIYLNLASMSNPRLCLSKYVDRNEMINFGMDYSPHSVIDVWDSKTRLYKRITINNQVFTINENCLKIQFRNVNMIPGK